MKKRLGSAASILWNTKVGSIQSRTSLIVSGDYLYVGTCGDSWNKRDRKDGVHCLNVRTGRDVWFSPTLSDVNEMALVGKDLIVPTDVGDVLVIDVTDGEIRFIVRADSAVYGKPIVYRSLGGWSAILASVEGTIYRLESGAQELVPIGGIGGGLRANLSPIGYDAFLAATENGRLVKARMSNGVILSHEIASIPPGKFGGTPAISASPIMMGDLAFVGYARETYDENAAVACINVRTEELAWTGGKVEDHVGNVRTTPVIVDDKLIVASAYTNAIHLLDPASGLVTGSVQLGQSVFQQWSSPVALSDRHVAVGRVDGVCSIIDVRTEKLVTSISLATADTEKLAQREDLHDGETFQLYPGEPAPAGAICGTPTVDGRTLILGTTDGNVAAISLDLQTSSRLH